MKSIFIECAVILSISYLHFVLSANLPADSTNALTGTDSISNPILGTAAGDVNTGSDGLSGALGSVGLLLDGMLSTVGTLTGNLVQVVGDVTGGFVNAAGLILEGVVGLTQDILDSLKIYTKEDIPLHYKLLGKNVFQCYEGILRKFQINYPENIRVVGNIYQIAEYYSLVHNYCLTLSTDSDISNCIDVVRISAGDEMNRYSIDLASVDVHTAAERGALIEEQLIQCYII